MPIQLPQGLQINAKQPVDTRLLLSKEMMKSQDDNVMPIKYFTVCVDDGKLYLYDKNNEIDEQTGRFRLAFDDVSADIELLKQQVQVLNSELVKKQDILTPGKNITIERDSEGNLIISSLGGGSVDPESLSEQLPEALKLALEEQESKGVQSGLVVDSEGNIKVNLDSDFLSIDEFNHITFSDFIIQSGE